MERGTFNDGASVKVKVNKGLLVWRKIVQNKPNNDRYRFKTSPTNYTISWNSIWRISIFKNSENSNHWNLSAIWSIKILIPPKDYDTCPLILPKPYQIIITRKVRKRREIIKAANTNGKNESVLKLLGGMDQVVNVYNNFIPVFDKTVCKPHKW